MYCFLLHSRSTQLFLLLFQDIVVANEIVDIVEKRMIGLYKDLESLKGAKNDINKDFTDCTAKINKLSLAYKNPNRNHTTVTLKQTSDLSDSSTDDAVCNNDKTESVKNHQNYLITYDENNNEIRTKISSSVSSCHDQYQKPSNEESQQLMNIFIKNVGDEHVENKNR